MKNITIKFRGKSLESNKWVYGFVFRIQNDDGSYYYFIQEDTTRHIQNVTETLHQVSSDSIGQYTGLNDKNGKEIYVGDVIEFEIKEWGGNDNIHVVSWDKEEAKFCFGGGCQKSDMEFRTVIGNIHEHKHLLKND